MRKLTRKRSMVVALAVLALLAAVAGSALAAVRGSNPKVTQGIATYDASASASPVMTTVGILLGDTWSATCNMPSAGAATLNVYLQTSDGSWKVDFGTLDDNNTSFAGEDIFSAGSLLTPTVAASASAGAGGHTENVHVDLVQLGPKTGRILLHLNTTTTATTATCHVTIEVFPDKIQRAIGPSAAAPHPNLSRPLLTR